MALGARSSGCAATIQREKHCPVVAEACALCLAPLIMSSPSALRIQYHGPWQRAQRGQQMVFGPILSPYHSAPPPPIWAAAGQAHRRAPRAVKATPTGNRALLGHRTLRKRPLPTLCCVGHGCPGFLEELWSGVHSVQRDAQILPFCAPPFLWCSGVLGTLHW